MSAGWMLACILAAVLLVSVICRKRDRKRKWSQVLWTVLAAVLLMAATGAVYLSMYSHHDESAEPFLISSETVAVTPASNGLMFDGPSDSRAVIFYPGAKVEAEAYAPLMYQIAEEWGDCFLVEMPFHMAMLDADAAKDKDVKLAGLSALMTTTVPAMEETIKKLHEETPGVKIMVGGAVMNEEYAAMIKADFYGRDAMASVRYAEEVLR